MKHILNKHILNKRDEVLGKEFETNSCGKCVIVGASGNKENAVNVAD